MNIKKLSWCFLVNCWMSCYANAEIPSKNDITAIKVYHIAPNTHDKSLILKITDNSIIKYIDKQCANEETVTSCLANSEETQYLGPHDIFDFIPASFLSGSDYTKQNKFEYERYKIETCFSDEHCNTWNWDFQHITDKDAVIFLNKINAILLDESEYQFQPKNKVTFTAHPLKKNLTEIYIHRPNKFMTPLVLKITANSIIKFSDPDIHFETERFPWSTYRIKEQYIGQHNLLDIIPLQLTTSLFCNKIYPLNCNGDNQVWLIESCYSDGSCNCWSSVDNWDDKEAMEFLDRMDEIIDNKSEYKFHPVNTFTSNKKIRDKKDISKINIYSLQSYPFAETLILEITPDSIKKHPYLKCEQKNGWHCFKEGAETQYLGHHELFNLLPTLFLSGSYFSDPRESGNNGSKIEICFTDGQCNLWGNDTPYIADKDKYEEIQTFLKELHMIKSDKSQYTFQPIDNK